jgi:PBSX family phage terminase large subunit
VPDLDLSPKQERSIRESDGRVNVWEGSIRSAKTVASLIRWLMFVAQAPRGGELVMVGRTRDAIGRNVLGPLQDPAIMGPLAKLTRYNTNAPTATILGRRVWVIGASDAKAEAVIRGMTVAGAYADEITVLPEAFWTQLLGRMSVPGAQLFGTTNPDNPAHWLKRKYLDRIGQLPDWRTWHFTLDDNPSLTPEYIASISREFTGLWYRRFILGEWVAAEGAIFPMWDPTPRTGHVVPWVELPLMRRLLATGVDYGTTNPSTGLLLGQGVDGRLYLVDEWRYDPAQHGGRSLTDAEQSARLREWLAGPHLPVPSSLRPSWMPVDPAAASFKTQLVNDGVQGVVNADNDVAYGLPLMASLLGDRERGLLVSDRCAGFIAEASGYTWDPKASAKGEDKPLKVADHSLDGARYAVVTTESVWRGQAADGAVFDVDVLDGELAEFSISPY